MILAERVSALTRAQRAKTGRRTDSLGAQFVGKTGPMAPAVFAVIEVLVHVADPGLHSSGVGFASLEEDRNDDEWQGKQRKMRG